MWKATSADGDERQRKNDTKRPGCDEMIQPNARQEEREVKEEEEEEE